MQQADGIGVADVQAVYDGAEGDLWELVMGEQIHIGGMSASMDLAERASIAAGSEGADLCCCNGAGMRFLVRFRDVGHMTGVDVTERIVRRGRARTSTLAGFAAIVISSPVAGLRPVRFLVAGLTRTVNCTTPPILTFSAFPSCSSTIVSSASTARLASALLSSALSATAVTNWACVNGTALLLRV